MSGKYAVLFDGGFVTKVLGSQLKKFPEVKDIVKEAERISSLSELADLSLLRYYFYDAPPLNKVVTNPIDGFNLDLGKSKVAKQSQSLHDSLELSANFAFRKGDTVFHGWKLGSAATKDMQSTPREPVAKDFVPDINQKGVDLRIGLDIARLSLRSLVDVIVVVAGDSDLVPAFKFARREGLRVYLDHLGQPVNRELKAHVDLIL